MVSPYAYPEKERVFQVLRGETPDQVPAAPAYLCLFLADFERAYYLEQYRLRMRGLSRYSVDHQEDTRFRAQAIYQAYGIFKERPDWMEIGQGASRSWAERTEIVDEDGVLYYEDKVTGERRSMHDSPLPQGSMEHAAEHDSTRDLWDTSGQISSKEQVDVRLPLPDPQALLARGDFDLPKQVVADYGDRFFVTTILDTPFSDAYDLLGFQGLMLIQHDRPKLFHYLLGRKLICTQKVMEAWAEVGIHGVYVEEVFTGADIISPPAYEEFVFAYNQPYFQHMSGLGLLPIHYVCGDVIPRLERIAQYSIAAVGVEESKKKFVIELEEVVRKVAGRVAVLGNIDAVRYGQNVSLEDMAVEANRQLRIGQDARGFLLSTGSPFPLDTNPRLIDTMIATAHAFNPHKE
jgi:uroporphyrinogen-III decarboxylase